jgi:hypothetical protein
MHHFLESFANLGKKKVTVVKEVVISEEERRRNESINGNL